MKVFDVQSIKREKVKKVMIPIIIVMLSIPVLWSFTVGGTRVYDLSSENQPWDTGWSQVTSEVTALDNVNEFQTIQIGETLVLVNDIPELASDKVFLFYTKDVEVAVFIDDELIYSYYMEEKFEFLETTGNVWNMLEITSDMSGSDIRIELTSQFSERFEGTVNTLYLINQCEILDVWWKQSGFRIIMSIAVFVMTITAYVNAMIWKRIQIKDCFRGLGHVCLSTTLWLFSMSGIMDMIWNRPITSYLISMLMVLVIPVTIYEFFKVTYRKRSRFIEALGAIVWGNLLFQFVLQFVFGVSLLNLLPLTYVVYAVGSICVIYIVIRHILLNRSKNDLNFALASTLIFFGGAVVEITILCMFPERTDLIGVAGVMGLFVYLVVNQIALIRFESRVDIEKIELEENYNELQNTTLIQQIKAHYFFNTLNTISALCKQDAREADRAIKLFASYMRSYMHLINKQCNIEVEQELELVKTSLDIELLRFPESFHYTMNIEYGDFKIPPLSIQPLVENAMLHGLRKNPEYGELRIDVRRVGDKAQITVVDNGTGFDVTILKTSDSIGLKNLKKRMEIMANGTVELKSAIGKGTEVILEIPIEE